MSWNNEENELVKTFEFEDFLEAIKFVNSVAVLAEQAQHHPDIEINYDAVTLRLTTHDDGNTVTQKDKDLAAEIDQL